MSIEEKLDEILKQAVRKARATDSTAWYFNSDWHKQQILELIKEALQEITKKPTTIPKTNNAEAVKQGINFYHKTIQKRLNQLSQQTPNK